MRSSRTQGCDGPNRDPPPGLRAAGMPRRPDRRGATRGDPVVGLAARLGAALDRAAWPPRTRGTWRPGQARKKREIAE